jgi:DNA-cytosine methyltransferase
VDGLTHASFFSGVGGLDMGLERAGWRTVSFSEIDPYASAVLRERWPGVANLGCIQSIAYGQPANPYHGHDKDGKCLALVQSEQRPSGRAATRRVGGATEDRDWRRSALWTGGFPCQGLSVAGKRRGLADPRSALAYAFLELVGRYRPRFVLLENVPGLLSSHGGRDMAALVGALVELGYGVGYRVLDARHFGVPQRRRRVFILGVTPGGRAGAERAAEVLSVGSRCRRHPPTGVEAGEDAADGARPGVDIARTVVGTAGKRHDEDIDTLVPQVWQGHGSNVGPFAAVRAGNGNSGGGVPFLLSPSPDPDRVRTPDGLAGRSHDRDGLADTLRVGGRASGAGDSYDNTPWIAETLNSGGNDGGFRTEPGAHLVAAYGKHRRAGEDDASPESWGEASVAPTVDSAGHGPRTATAVLGGSVNDDPLLPLGLDSHRYRCCGNGVVSDVSFWIGLRLAEAAA